MKSQVGDWSGCHNVEKFVLVIMFVPMELAPTDTQSHKTIVHPAQRLLKPHLLALLHDLRDVDNFKRPKGNVSID